MEMYDRGLNKSENYYGGVRTIKNVDVGFEPRIDLSKASDLAIAEEIAEHRRQCCI